MTLQRKEINHEFKDMERFAAINEEAFPVEERMPLEAMMEMLNEGKVEVSALYDDELFVGFYTTATYKKMAYILLLAIDSKIRSKGYGGQALALMKQQYEGYQIVLDLESVEDNAAKNLEQRIIRKNFYLRNGFYETKYGMNFNGMSMEVMGNIENIDVVNFRALIRQKLNFEDVIMDIYEKA